MYYYEPIPSKWRYAWRLIDVDVTFAFESRNQVLICNKNVDVMEKKLPAIYVRPWQVSKWSDFMRPLNYLNAFQRWWIQFKAQASFLYVIHVWNIQIEIAWKNSVFNGMHMHII